MRKKILIIISSLKLGGGAERVASVLGTELYNRNYDIHFMTFYKHNNNYDFKGKHICLNETFKKNIISKSFKLFIRAKKIAKYCKDNKIDTCIGFMEAANFPTIISKILLSNKSKIIISIHNDLEVLLANKMDKILIKFLYPKANMIIGVSNSLKSKLKKLKLKNIKIIYNLNNINKFIKKSEYSIKNKKFTQNDENFKFINIGRLVKQKNQEILIKAFSKVKFKNKKLYILGEGNKRKELEFLIQKLKLENHVFLLGNIKNVYSYLKNCDCFVLSSIHEGFGLTLVEALTFNKPIISTDCNVGPREILAPEIKLTQKLKYPYYGNYGILINNNNIDKTEKELILMMENIIKDNKLQKKYSNGINRAKDFDINNIIKEWEKII